MKKRRKLITLIDMSTVILLFELSGHVCYFSERLDTMMKNIM